MGQVVLWVLEVQWDQVVQWDVVVDGVQVDEPFGGSGAAVEIQPEAVQDLEVIREPLMRNTDGP